MVNQVKRWTAKRLSGAAWPSASSEHVEILALIKMGVCVENKVTSPEMDRFRNGLRQAWVRQVNYCR